MFLNLLSPKEKEICNDRNFSTIDTFEENNFNCLTKYFCGTINKSIGCVEQDTEQKELIWDDDINFTVEIAKEFMIGS